MPVPTSESDNLQFSMALGALPTWLGIKLENDYCINIYSGNKLKYDNWSKSSKTKSKLIYGFLQLRDPQTGHFE